MMPSPRREERTMDTPVNPAISLLDEVKVQAQVLVPILRALRADIR
jgi:hypothetical protein